MGYNHHRKPRLQTWVNDAEATGQVIPIFAIDRLAAAEDLQDLELPEKAGGHHSSARAGHA